jgi:hypothetical protein
MDRHGNDNNNTSTYIMDYFKAETIGETLSLLKSGLKGQSVVYKMASGKYQAPFNKYVVKLINALLTTILISIPITIIYLWLRKF